MCEAGTELFCINQINTNLQSVYDNSLKHTSLDVRDVKQV